MVSKNKNLKFKSRIFDFDSDDSYEFTIPSKRIRKDPVEETQVQLSSKSSDNFVNELEDNTATNRHKYDNTHKSLNLLKQNMSKTSKSQNVEVTPTNNRNESRLDDNVNSNLIGPSKSNKQTLSDLSNNNNIFKNDDIEIIRRQVIQSENTVNARTSSSLENEKQVQNLLNFETFVMKVMDELKRTLSKFISQMSSIQQKILKDEIVSQQDANDSVFIISCILSKLKEEINEQEKNFTNLSKLQEFRMCNCEEYAQGKSNLNKNDLELQNSEPPSFNNSHFFKRSLSVANKTIMDNINYVESKYAQLNSDVGKKKDSLPLRINVTSTSTSTLQNCKKNTAIWNNQSLVSVLGRLKEITIIKKPIKKSVGGSKSTGNNEVDICIVNRKQINPVRVGSPTIVTTDHYVTMKEDSTKNKSVLNLYPVRSHNVQHTYKNKRNTIDTDLNENGVISRSLASSNYSSDEQMVYSFQPANLNYCNLSETIITSRTNSFLNGQSTNKSDAENEIDPEVLSLYSSDSSTFSAYIIPTNLNKKSTNYSSRTRPLTINNYRNNEDEKLSMTCNVSLEKLNM